MMSQAKTEILVARHRLLPWRWVSVVLLVVLVAAMAWWATRPTPTQQFQAGLVALSLGDLPQVTEVARALSSRRDYKPHAHFLRGAVLLKRGKPREALEELRLAVEHDEVRVPAQVLAGEALAKIGQSLQATEVLRQALGREPDNVDAHRWAGIAYYDLGAMQPAVHHLERLAALDPGDPRPHRVMGLIYKDLENDQLAAKCYQQSLTRSVDQSDIDAIRTELAEVQIRLNRHEDARKTLADCSPSPRVSALLAECEYALGNVDAAKELLARSLRRDPLDSQALKLQGTMALDQSRAEEAVEAFRQIVDLDRTDFSARFKLSQAYAQLGDNVKAAAELATMNEIKELRREADTVYQQAVKEPRDAEARFRLGVLSEKLERPDLAMMWYHAALAIDPRHGPASAALKGLDEPDGQRQTTR